MTADPSPPVRRSPFRVGAADVVFVFFALAILQRAGSGIVDDPGLGWHLRIADAMVEQGGFLRADPFGLPTQGEPWVPFGFLGSMLFLLWSAALGVHLTVRRPRTAPAEEREPALQHR